MATADLGQKSRQLQDVIATREEEVDELKRVIANKERLG
jgi:hypothetical protein